MNQLNEYLFQDEYVRILECTIVHRAHIRFTIAVRILHKAFVKHTPLAVAFLHFSILRIYVVQDYPHLIALKNNTLASQ